MSRPKWKPIYSARTAPSGATYTLRKGGVRPSRYHRKRYYGPRRHTRQALRLGILLLIITIAFILSQVDP